MYEIESTFSLKTLESDSYTYLLKNLTFFFNKIAFQRPRLLFGKIKIPHFFAQNIHKTF